MRKALCTTVLLVALTAGGAVSAVAANGVPQRPDGPVTPVAPSDNGGDNGWGNCGHNSSRGNPHSDPAGGGNGGYKKGDDCGAVTPPGGGGVAAAVAARSRRPTPDPPSSDDPALLANLRPATTITCLGPDLLLVGVPLLAPGVADEVVAALLPEAAHRAAVVLDAAQPLRALEAVEVRHHQPQRPAVLGCERLAVGARRPAGRAGWRRPRSAAWRSSRTRPRRARASRRRRAARGRAARAPARRPSAGR